MESQKSSNLYRNWMFTSLKQEVIDNVQLRLAEIKYIRIQEEIGEKEGGRHFQGYAIFFNAKSLNAVKILLCDDQAHCTSVAKKEAAYRYVRKTVTQGLLFFEHGNALSAGVGFKALDMRVKNESSKVELVDSLADRIKNSMYTVEYIKRFARKLYVDLIEFYPDYEILVSQNPLHVVYIHGNSGLGKTEFKAFFAEFLKIKLYNIDTMRYFDGITSDVRALGIDEFRNGTMNIVNFNKFVDNQIPRKPVKGGSVAVDADFLIITTNHDISCIYPRESGTIKETFLRRMDAYIHIERFTKTDNKIKLTIKDHLKEIDYIYHFIVPISKPENFPFIRNIIRIIISTLIERYKLTENSSNKYKAFIEYYTPKIESLTHHPAPPTNSNV